MMEPVAYLYTGGGREPEASSRKFQDITIWAHNRTEEALVRLSDAEARIRELEAALDEKEIASGLTHNGSMWRFWSAKAKDVAVKLAAAEARAEAAEALLKEAREALKASSQLIDRMMHVHVAPDECTSYVEGSRRWFMENGGSLAAIADQQAMNRRALEEKA